MRRRVLVTRLLPEGGLAPLQDDRFEVAGRRVDTPYSHDELVAASAEADGIVCVLSDCVDEAVLAAGSGRLRVVANVAVGYDNIDVAAAAAQNVVVCNTPGVLDEATADITFLLLLAACRRSGPAEADLRAGRWQGWQLTGYLGKELAGATLGLVGYGRIAKAVERRAVGFGMRTIHHTRSDSGAPGWTRSVDELLARSDVVSLHVPSTPATHHLIDRRRLASMRPDAVLINTARGQVVDTLALVDTLESGHLFGVGLDVYDSEPQVHPRLLAAPRTVLLPHIGSATTETRTRMAVMACRAVADVLDGKQPGNVVPPAGARTT